MTLYRVGRGVVEVLMEDKWKILPAGTEEQILPPELNPQPMGQDENYRYIRTDEPGPVDGPMEVSLRGLQKSSYKVGKKHDWYVDVPTPTHLLMVHSEVTEAFEEWRVKGADLTEIYYSPVGKPLGFPIEMGDIVQRVCGLAEHLGVDLTRAIVTKEAWNKTRDFESERKKA